MKNVLKLLDDLLLVFPDMKWMMENPAGTPGTTWNAQTKQFLYF